MKRSLEETIEWRLGHIREQILRSEDLVNRGFDAFLDDWALQAAAKDAIETLGEAVAAIQQAAGLNGNDMPEPLNDLDVPWSLWKRFRDKATHKYYELEYATIIWHTLVNDFPDVGFELDKVCSEDGRLFPSLDDKLAGKSKKLEMSGRICGSRNTVNGKPCQNPSGCSIKGH